jgi:anti-anti-sigma factor
MDFTVDEKGECLTLFISGDPDAAAGLDEQIARLIEGDSRDVVIDLKGLARIDSMTLALLLGFKNDMAKRNRKLRVRNPENSVRRVFEMATLDTFLLEE